MKIEQVAIATESIEQADKIINTLKKIGMTDWVEDHVVATGEVFGEPGTNKARLSFNYQMGFELEILTYLEGDNWHKKRSETTSFPFQSHMGLHVDEAEMEKIGKDMADIGIGIAQEVFTDSHTNPAIAGIRRYHYVVFDSKEQLGFDLKLIERLPDRG